MQQRLLAAHELIWTGPEESVDRVLVKFAASPKEDHGQGVNVAVEESSESFQCFPWGCSGLRAAGDTG